jgi:trehalose-phosphatase
MRHILFLDYDGTLTPIVSKPSLAVLSKSRRAVLKKISKRLLTAVISGRMLSDLKKRVGITGLYFAGNHGFEIQGPKISLTHPKALQAKPLIRQIKFKLQKNLKGIKGIIVEDKILTLSLHYRMARAKDFKRIKKIFSDTTKPFLKTKKIKITYGKKVFEVRPNIPWNKGHAVLWFLRKLAKGKKLIPIYIGDDLTDEDAFLALKNKGITIRVGKSAKTHAKYYVKDVDGVYRFIKNIFGV